MNKPFIAKTSVTVNAPVIKVWDALVNPEKIREYMFGTTVLSDWEEGSPIIWKGEWEGKAYEDEGKILQLKPEKLIQYSHSVAGQEDNGENYHTITIELSEEKAGVLLTLTQDNNPSEQARDHSEKNWNMMLTGLKKLVEAG